MNICFVLFSVGWGGAETVIYDLARYLCGKGEKVSIILNQEIIKYYTDLENVNLFNIGALYPPKSIIPRLGSAGEKRNLLHRFFKLFYAYSDEPLRYLYLKRSRRRLIQFLSDNNIDVISPILEDSVPLVSDLANDLKMLKIATITMVAGEYNLRGLEPFHPLLSPLVKWKERKFRKALKKADRVIGPSTFVLNAWQDKGIALEHKYVVIPNGVNLSEIQSSLVPNSRLKGEFNVLFPGGSKFIKGGDLLVESLPIVMREIPNIHVYIAWKVPQNHSLRRLVKDLGLEENVTFVGLLARQEYYRLLNSVDLLVMPSREEAFGIVYIEAMALGKPVIAANTGGAPEVVENGRNGIIVELNPAQIAEAIAHLYRDEKLRIEMGQNNLQDVTTFDWSHVVDQYINVYREALESRTS